MNFLLKVKAVVPAGAYPVRSVENFAFTIPIKLMSAAQHTAQQILLTIPNGTEAPGLYSTVNPFLTRHTFGRHYAYHTSPKLSNVINGKVKSSGQGEDEGTYQCQ